MTEEGSVPEIVGPITDHGQEDESPQAGEGEVVYSYVSAAYSGMLPPPESMVEYEQLQSGTLDRLLAFAEKEQSFRHVQEGRRQLAEEEQDIRSHEIERRGQVLGFGVVLATSLTGLAMAYMKQPTPAVIIALSGPVILAVAFILGKKFDLNFVEAMKKLKSEDNENEQLEDSKNHPT